MTTSQHRTPEGLQRRYRKTQRWFRNNPEKRRAYNAKYYARTAEKRREVARLNRVANPERVKQANSTFIARNPNYMREYAARKKIRTAWRKWSGQCAISRQSLGASYG